MTSQKARQAELWNAVMAFFPADLHGEVAACLHNESEWGINGCLWELPEDQRVAVWVDAWTAVKALWESWE